MSNFPVLFIWVNYVNDRRNNACYSAHVDDIYRNEDPFQENGVPCWSEDLKIGDGQ